MNYWIESSLINRMINRLANPSPVKQAPDARALMKATNLVVVPEPGSSPAQLQNYFEPGVNVKLTRRKTPKTNYTLPSDLPTYPLGFVPTNKDSLARGEEPSIIQVRESAPADLLEVFAKINAEEQVLAKMPKNGVDSGQEVATEYLNALKEKNITAIVDKLVSEGYDDEMIEDALYETKMDSLKRRLKNM